MKAGMRREAAAAAVAAVACLLGFAPAALAADTHVFNAFRSLTGDCTTSGIDPVPDPGCPNPPHPPTGFVEPTNATTDQFGNLFISTFGDPGSGAGGGVDIFDADGNFVFHLSAVGAKSVAVDSTGVLYVFQRAVIGSDRTIRVARFDPDPSNVPEDGEIEYLGSPITILAELQEGLFDNNAVAVNPANDHLFVNLANHISEYGSAAEANPLLDNTIGAGTLRNGKRLAIDGSTGYLYSSASVTPDVGSPSVIMVFDTEAPGNPLLVTITGSGNPVGGFKSLGGLISPAIDEASGHLFVDDLNAPGGGKKFVYEFEEFSAGAEGGYVGRIERSLSAISSGNEIWVDNSGTATQGVLYVPSAPKHILAFEPIPVPEPPEIGDIFVKNVTDDEAEVSGTINPNVAETVYELRIVAVEEGATPSVIDSGTLPAENEPIGFVAFADGLAADTEYLVEVGASNSDGTDEADVSFRTFASPAPGACPNETLRQGLSSLLPDCRAYELVTPPDTNGHEPGSFTFGQEFTMPLSSAQGDDFAFLLFGGSLPGTDGSGAFNGDAYRALRGSNGWQTIPAGPTGTEAAAPIQGSMSPEHHYAFWQTGEDGSAVIEAKPTSYLRYPSGESRLVGRGSLGTDPRAVGRLITDNAQHIIFETRSIYGAPVQLELNAPPSGTVAIYDRTPDEVTHVVSLLPGDVPPPAGENAFYRGASRDGSAIAFRLGGQEPASPLYLRVDNAETLEAAPAGARFSGLSADGTSLFFENGGDLFRFNVAAGSTTPIATTGDAKFSNVAPDGSSAYFLSPTALPDAGSNPEGASPQAGEPNLYYWREGGAVSFVATLTERDAEGEPNSFAQGGFQNGAGLWTSAVEFIVAAAQPAIVSTRTSESGEVVLFESRAPLTGAPTKGLPQIYRYDSAAVELSCLSCTSTGLPSSGGARLQTLEINAYNKTYFTDVRNLRPDGRRAFFESSEPLVPEDTNGRLDVYQWEDAGVGTCKRSDGCVSLISSGRSARNSYLFGTSATGDDAFILTADRLVPEDASDTPSIYDARVNGGSVRSNPISCAAEGCRPPLSPVPPLAAPASPTGPSGNAIPKNRCPKGKHKVTKKGKTRCVKKSKKGNGHRKQPRGQKRGGRR